MPEAMISHDVDLSSRNTFFMPVRSACLVNLTQSDQLSELEPLLAGLPQPVMVLGGGSNLLFAADYKGTLVCNQLRGIDVQECEDHWILHVAGGENWHELVAWSVQQDYPGLENLALIPGLVGAAPVQNIGAFGVEFKDVCHYVEYLCLESGQIHRLTNSECRFSYRDSIFKHELKRCLITRVGISLAKAWLPVLGYGALTALDERTPASAILDEVCRQRLSRLPDPQVLGNAGSFFKNPQVSADRAAQLALEHPGMPQYPLDTPEQVKLAAGWLIEQCGLKGLSLGQAAVHHQQALVLVNRGGARPEEVIALASRVRHAVWQRFGVVLEPEVRLIGAAGELCWDEVLDELK